MLRSSLERQFDKTNFISPKSTPSKSLGLLGLRKTFIMAWYQSWNVECKIPKVVRLQGNGYLDLNFPSFLIS